MKKSLIPADRPAALGGIAPFDGGGMLKASIQSAARSMAV
jgi:hypothetical protein